MRLGQSASVGLTLGELQAHKVSSSVLSLAADGSIFVNAVDDNNQVVRHEVEIIKNDSDGVWLSGLPKQLRLIVVGQAFVAEGQTVEVSIEGDA
jgi:multidrug efflux system membrane fusion protein